jgi:hypothetical protein
MPRKKGPSAREPRVQTESMRDFADFIRSTGPQNERDNVRPVVASGGSSDSFKSGSLLGRKPSTSRATSINAEDPSAPRTRIHLVPRSPAASHGQDSNELIDFIRQGPPPEKGEHRVNRSVAPFRTTMDSDEFKQMYSDRSPENTPVQSQFGSANSQTTTRSSSNSRTHLLPPTSSGAIQQNLSPGEPVIQRTRRRIRDPYAIDDSDEDEDLLTELPKSAAPTRQEESLIDFLKNVPPPSNTTPQPLNLDSATVAAARARNAAFLSGQANGVNGTGNGANTSARRTPSSSATSSPALGASSVSASKSRGARPTARDARTDREQASRSTAELAKFLRSSAPPNEAVATPGLLKLGREKEVSSPAKSSRPFWSRKKSNEV